MELAIQHDIVIPSEPLLITRQRNVIRSGLLNADAVVGKALGRMEVEDEKKASAFKHKNLVYLVLERNISLEATIEVITRRREDSPIEQYC